MKKGRDIFLRRKFWDKSSLLDSVRELIKENSVAWSEGCWVTWKIESINSIGNCRCTIKFSLFLQCSNNL